MGQEFEGYQIPWDRLKEYGFDKKFKSSQLVVVQSVGFNSAKVQEWG